MCRGSLASISTVASEVGIVVALDKLDDSWEGSDQSKHLLIGLLKACKDVNDKYKGESPASGFSVVAFLRADIYEGLKFDDKGAPLKTHDFRADDARNRARV